MAKNVKVTYNADTIKTEIIVDGKPFDTSRIDGKEIADWAYPFMMRKVKWNGFYDEMIEVLSEKEFNLVFEGSDSDLNELKEALEDVPVTIISEENSGNNVVIEYDENSLTTNITINGNPFDTSRINGKEIADWAYPFMMRKVKWDGFYDEMVSALDDEKAFNIVFNGSEKALAELKEALEDAPVTIVSEESSKISSFASSNITNEEISERFDEMTYGTNPDYAAVLDYIIPLAEQGYSEAQSLLGMMYQLGWGVNVDHNNAFDWHMEAAKQNNAASCGDVAEYYAHEELRIAPKVSKDLEKAEYWYTKAAEYGDESDKFDCAVFLMSIDKYKEAVKWYRKSAEQDHAMAQHNLGYCYHHGIGIEQNYTEAVKWYKNLLNRATNMHRTISVNVTIGDRVLNKMPPKL